MSSSSQAADAPGTKRGSCDSSLADPPQKRTARIPMTWAKLCEMKRKIAANGQDRISESPQQEPSKTSSPFHGHGDGCSMSSTSGATGAPGPERGSRDSSLADPPQKKNARIPMTWAKLCEKEGKMPANRQIEITEAPQQNPAKTPARPHGHSDWLVIDSPFSNHSDAAQVSTNLNDPFSSEASYCVPSSGCNSDGKDAQEEEGSQAASGEWDFCERED